MPAERSSARARNTCEIGLLMMSTTWAEAVSGYFSLRSK
jgi:hypothetical protein